MAVRFQPLSDRDQAVVVSVYRYRYLTTKQIQRLHFPSPTPCYRALTRLSKLGLIEPFTVPNVSERVFRLKKSGAQLVADTRGVETRELPYWKARRKKPNYLHFMRHFLGVNDFRIGVEEEVSEREDVELRLWVPEYAGTRDRRGVPRKLLTESTTSLDTGQLLSHTPDAAFALERGGRAGLFLLEYDRGTEAVTNPDKGVLKFVRFYLAALSGGGFERFRTRLPEPVPGFRVLVVFESERRQESVRRRLSEAIAPEYHAALRFFWSEVIPVHKPLQREWGSLLARDDAMYHLVR